MTMMLGTNLDAVELVVIIARIGLVEGRIVDNIIAVDINSIMCERAVFVDWNQEIS